MKMPTCGSPASWVSCRWKRASTCGTHPAIPGVRKRVSPPAFISTIPKPEHWWWMASAKPRPAMSPESGRYDVFISPMRENVCWFYTLGWPFLRVEAIVEDGRARLERVRVVTLGTIRRENLLRAVGRAFTLPISTIARNRSLIRTMVRRDILGRYRGSFGGVFWTILNPLLLMLTYFFVFGVVLQTRFGSDPSRASFALYFLAGMLPWLAFSEAAGRAPSVVLAPRHLGQ